MAKISLIKLWTKEEHQQILGSFLNNNDAAIAYNNKFRKGDVLVSRQLVRYWRSIFMDNKGSKAKANNALKQARKLIQPSPTDDIGDTFVPETCRRVLVIGDLHEPYTHPDAYDFLRTVRDEYCPDIVVQIGDETDGHAISFHDSSPELDSAGVELEKAKLGLERLHNLFPNLLLCDSNHGSLIYRRAKAHGLPVQFIKKYRDILFPEHGAPGWSWGDAWDLNTPLGIVRFQHQVSGDLLLNAAHERKSMVIGHFHGKLDIQYAASSTALYFGAHCGCLIDNKSLAFAYGKLSRSKPILGCMVITDGCPQIIPMLLDDSGKWVGSSK
ncbi:metallo-phosphoesterase [Klebsiella phage vB_Kpn_K15PH90]|uniref:Metallo-phosphoesterase n=1 Tax=Klebsiella phage vB_Kpn_K15PH90 TaxID=3071635 RepID=A0AAV1MJX6_9CAUD|nr:metallo-phosphoesterase [Klebsiella phage vB_Kpn_K15PH90]